MWASCSTGDNFGLAGFAIDIAGVNVDGATDPLNMAPKCDFDSIAASKLGFTLGRSFDGTLPLSGAQDSTVPASLWRGIGLTPGKLGPAGSICYAGGVQIEYGLGNPLGPVPLSGTNPDGSPMELELAPGAVLLASGTTEDCCGVEFVQLAANVFLEDTGTQTAAANIELITVTNCIPEPSTWVLLVMGGLSLLIWRRRK
jgi:hypothetical protein